MSDQVTFTLDGQTVHSACRFDNLGSGKWPWFDYSASLPQNLRLAIVLMGNCRACMVEIEGERTLAASCIREPSEGMVVTTNSARAEGARKMVLEMLLADQPKRVESHDKSSHLWDMAKINGIDQSRFPKMEDGRIPLLDDSHVAMSVNLDACIQCGLCVRACREVQVNDVIGMAGRGHNSYPTFDFADPMGESTCVACGECVQACPTGALMPATVVDDNQIGGQSGL